MFKPSISELVAMQTRGEVSNVNRPRLTDRKERPTCSCCGIMGHKKDKCYKLHGYPPSFKRNFDDKCPQRPQINNVAVESDSSKEIRNATQVGELTSSQCQPLIAMLTSQLQGALVSSSNDPILPLISNFQGNLIALSVSSISWI